LVGSTDELRAVIPAVSPGSLERDVGAPVRLPPSRGDEPAQRKAFAESASAPVAGGHVLVTDAVRTGGAAAAD
jgi:hypothetical protein